MQSGNDEAVVSLVIDASGLRQGSTEAVALGKRLIDSFKAVETAAKAVGNVVSSSGAEIVESTTNTARFLDQLERKLNPLATAANKAEEEMKRLIKIMGGTNVEAAQRASVALELQAKKVLELKNAIVLASGENKRLEATYESLNRAFQNAVGSLGSLIAKYQPASASAKQMTSELASLNAAYKAGLIVEENYIAMNAKIINSYNEGAVAAQKLAESRARLIAQGRADQNVQTAQTGIMQVTGQQAGTDFSRDLRLQMEKDNELLIFEKQIDNEILNSRKQRLAQEMAARKSATDVMIADLKRLQIEETKANTDRFKYQEQMAPKSNVAQHTQDVAKQQQDVAKAAKEAADRLDNLTAKYSQDAVAAANYKKTMSELNEVFGKGRIGHQELSVETSKAIDQYNKSTVAGQAAAKAHKGLATDIHEVGLNTRVAQYAMTNFSFQINDVVSGLAMGQQPFRIFAQQAGQFVQIFQQIGRENIGTFFKTMGNDIVSFGGAVGRWLITPTGLAVTAVAGLSAGFLILLTRASNNEFQLKKFDIALSGVGVSSGVTSTGLQKLAFDLRAAGLSASDAEKSILSLTRNLSVNLNNPNSISKVANLGLNVGARLGVSDEEGIGQTNQALAGGLESVIKLGLATRALTIDEAAAAQAAALHGNRLQALNGIIQLLDMRLDGEHKRAMGTMTAASNSLAGAWNDLLNKLSDNSWFQVTNRNLITFTNNLASLVSTGKIPKDSLLGQIVGAGDTTTSTTRQGYTTQQRTERGKAAQIKTFGYIVPTFSVGGGISLDSQVDLESEFKTGTTLERIGGLTPGDSAGVARFKGATSLGNIPASTRFQPLSVDNASGVRTGLMSPVAGVGNAVLDSNVAARSTEEILKQENALAKLGITTTDQIRVSKEFAIEQQVLQGFLDTYRSAIDSGATATEAQTQAQEKSNAVREIANNELEKGFQVQKLENEGVLDTAKAYGKNEDAGLKEAAMTQARVSALTTGVDQTRKYNELLVTSSVLALEGAAKQNAAQVPIIAGQQRLAEAAKISGKAEHDVRIENEAATQTQDALNKARATGNETLIKMAENLNKEARAQILSKEAAQNSLLTTQFLNKEKDAQQVLQLEIGLRGQTTEEINRQVVLLQEAQRLQRDTTGLLPQEKQLRLDAVAATQRMTVALAESNREQQRLESGIKSIADTIDSTIGKSITDMFDGKKIDDWGTKLKSMFSTISSSLVSSQITKPLIGTVLSGMGLTGLSSTFGTFGTSLFGGSSTSTASSGSITLTPSSDGKSFTFDTVKDAAGAGKSVLDLFGTTSSVATEAPGFLSSAFSGSEFLFGTGLDFGGGGAAMGVADVLGGAEAIAGTSGLLGGLGSFSSAIPYIGPAIAVASMVLPMLFQKKPSNFAAGGNIDLSAGGTIGFKSNEGNSANTASANRIMDGISEFAADLIKETGGQLIGNLNVQAGSRDGIKIAGNIGSTNNLRTTESILSTEGIKFSSESEAIELTSLAMVKLIEGVSDTMATVLDSITDLDDLAEGIDFANTYDSLKDAFDSAFADVEPDIVGPYADALVEIGDIFDELTEGAEKFGLSLEPIDAGLTEANKRLLEDFNKEVADAILALEDPTESLIQIEKEAGKVRISDAIAVGADLAEVTRLNGLYLLEIANDGYRSIEDFNKEINDSILELTDPFKLLVEQEKELGQARLDEAIAIGASVVEVNRLNALTLDDIWETQVENLKDLRDELKSGSLSGLTVGEQVQAANDNFQTTLRLVRGGDLNEVENLVTRGQDALSLSEEAYGNAPETASLRNQILTSVDDVLASRSFAGGSESTPEGWIRVGENGPEWMKQSGGNKILPSGTSPGNDSGQLLSEVRKLNNLLEGGNLISREGFSQTIKRLEKVIGGVSKQTLSQPTRTKVA